MKILKNRGLIIAAFCFVCLPVLPLRATPVAIAGISQLVADSDVIAVGSIASVASLQSGSGRLVLQVESILKGDYTNGILYLSYKAVSVGTEQGMLGTRVLAFGKINGNGGYDLLPMAYGPVVSLSSEVLNLGPQSAVSGLEMTSGDNPLQKVMKVLALTQFGSQSVAALPYLLPLATAGVEPKLAANLFHIIQGSVHNGSNTAAAGLVAMGTVDGLVAAEALNITQHPELATIIAQVEIYYRDTSQAGLQILTEWLDPSMPPAQRRAAIGALARIHTAAAIPQLGIALDDTDPGVRWRAIGGLSMFANNVPIGGLGPAAGPWAFRTKDTINFSAFDEKVVSKNEAAYLNFWRQWWNQNQGAIQALSQAQR